MMESRFQVILLRLASEDVDSIYEWLTGRSPAGASRWYSALLDASKSLETVPDLHALAPEASKLPSPFGNVCSELVVEDSTESCSLLWAARCASYACADLASNLSLPTMFLRPLKNDAQISIES